MAVMSRLLPLVAFSTFAIFVLALLATPANALSNEPHVHVGRGHDSIAKRKRNAVKRAKRCRPQVAALSTSSTPDSTPTPVPTTTSSKPPAAASTSKAKTSTTSSAAPESTPYSGGTSTKKLLLAWPNGSTDLAKYKGNNVVGMYTWSPYCPDNAASLGIPCYQMLWGTKQKSAFTTELDTKDCGYVFGFNEPNQDGQSDMSPQDAAALWKSMIQPLKAKGCKLVSPATTSAPTGKTWMQDMMKACGSDQCQFDSLALHWYGTSADEFKAYVTDFYNTFKKPIIISEYACQNFAGGAQCSKDQTLNFHYTMGKWFDSNPNVLMYAPFGFMHDMVNVNYDNQLMASNGSPNDLGNWYLYHS